MLRHPRACVRPLASVIASSIRRASLAGHQQRYASTATSDVVKIVEVGPRDGLQNERTALAADIKATLIDRLSALGLSCVESGSFVSPKWVPQMAGTADVLTAIAPRKGVSYPVLVPNAHGLQAFLALRRENPELSASLDEIAVFTAASDAFSRANTNVSVAESLAKLEGVAADARKEGLRVRGYVSVVIECPYGGRVEPARVREVSRALRDMGCYEVSLGDTVGRGTPDDIHTVVAEVAKDVPVGMLAGHFHDTYGMGVANCAAALDAGVRTLDASIAGLGGCPYSPGATGNVATEDVLYLLARSQYTTPALAGVADKEARIAELADVGWWISSQLGRETTSRVGKALRARREREKQQAEKPKPKL